MQAAGPQVKRVSEVIQELENYSADYKICVVASSQDGWTLMPIQYMGRSTESNDDDGMVLLRCELPQTLRAINEHDFSWVKPEDFQTVEWVLNFLKEAPEQFGVCVHLDTAKGWAWPVIQKIALFPQVDKMVIVACGIPSEFMSYQDDSK